MYNGSHARAKKHSRIRMNKLPILCQIEVAFHTMI